MRKAESFGARLNNDFSTAEVSFPEAAQAKTFPYTAWLGKVDAIIDLCKLKTHAMMGMTCAVKSFFGSIPGARKPEFHYSYPRAEDFANVLADLYEYSKPASVSATLSSAWRATVPQWGRRGRSAACSPAETGTCLTPWRQS